jgi:hypothetical protein
VLTKLCLCCVRVRVANKLLQLFVCWECETTYDAFSKAVLVRIVPVPPVSPSSSGGTLVSLASHSLATTLDSLPGIPLCLA